MFTSCTTPFYTKQDSTSSTESNDKEAASLKNTIQYGPISIRLCKKQAPTLETGRRSKHLVLVGEEAIKREKRREKNREAARKLKEKRQLIEEELSQKLKDLENQHSSLENYLQELHQRKQILQNEVNNILVDSLEELLSNDSHDITLFVKQYSNDFDLFDESIDTLLNYDLDTSFYPITNK